MKITIAGDGGWGTAIAMLLDSYGHLVTVWGPCAEYLEVVSARRMNPKFLPGIELPETLRWRSEAGDAAAGAEVFVIAAPSAYFREVCLKFQGVVPRNALVVSLTKGLCEQSAKRMSEVAGEILDRADIAVLSGPSHAEEVARAMPTAVVAAAPRDSLARSVQTLFHGARFRVYTSTDVRGVEIGGAVKNVIAIAVGASDGLGFGDNTRAALITRGLAEISRLGVSLGARAETFAGLSGMGDLVVTCTSRHSRNHTVGQRLGEGASLEEILAGTNMVAEGVRNARVVRELACARGVEMPITEIVHEICFEGLPAREAIGVLMEREVRDEN